MKTTAIKQLREKILASTEHCVACGLCLPWCPTYQLSNVEFESPRGRIALLQGLANSKLTPHASTTELLNHCLLCRSCEKHCPSKVSFGEAMDAGRQLMQRPTSLGGELSRKLSDYALRYPEWLRRLLLPAVVLGKIVPPSLTRKAGNSRIFKLLSYLPSLQLHSRWDSTLQAKTPRRGCVDLFLGCAARSMDAKTIDNSISLLNLQGFDVHIPSEQSCCGAISLHSGRNTSAVSLMNNNLAAFSNSPASSIIHMSTGCGITLAEYARHVDDRDDISERINEICTFLDKHWQDVTPIVHANKHVLLHMPCSADGSIAPERLLKRIPGLQLSHMKNTHGCCGSAGTYMLSHSEVAAELRAPLIEQVSQLRPDVVATTNPGCALHLAEGLRTLEIDIPVVHPVSILAAQVK